MAKRKRVYKGRFVHKVYPQKQNGSKTGKVVVVLTTPHGPPRPQVVLTEQQFRDQTSLVSVD